MESQFLPIVFDVLQYHLTDKNTLVCHFPNRDALADYMKTTFHAVFMDIMSSQDIFIEYDAVFSRCIAIIQVNDSAVSPVLRIHCESFM